MQISAIFSGVADLKKVFEEARARRETGQGTLLFVDEIHRFNRAQQDSFLPVMEDGTIVLVGATTENPSFELIAPMLSRARVLVFKSLDAEAVEKLLARAEELEGKKLPLDAEARAVARPHGRRRWPRLADAGRGNLARRAARRDLRSGGAAEGGAAARADLRQEAGRPLQPDLGAAQVGARLRSRRRALLSRRMLDAGEDPLYLARRVVRMAVEDIGLADPQALVICNAAKDAYDFLGSPEGELAIAEAVIYVATAPKSNAAYVAYGAAKRAAKENGSLLPPKHILNAPTNLMKSEGYGRGYAYDHDARGGILRPGLFPGGTRPPDSSTIRPSAASSAKSGSAWTTGPSFARTGLAIDAATSGVGGLRDRRGHGVVRACGRAFVGRWAVKPELCSSHGGDTPQTAALVATDTSLWWFDGYCRIGKMYKAKAVYVQAHCGAKGDVSVTLDAQRRPDARDLGPRQGRGAEAVQLSARASRARLSESPLRIRRPSVFRHRAFALYWFSRIASILSFHMLVVAIGWQLYELTGSAFDLGLLGLAQFVPMLVLTLFVGHVADRYDHRIILMLCQITEALRRRDPGLCAPRRARSALRSIYVVVAVVGSARAFEIPTMAAIISSLVPRAAGAFGDGVVRLGQPDRADRRAGARRRALSARARRRSMASPSRCGASAAFCWR